MSRTGPLEDLLVIDMTRVLAGPFAAMMLADLGARVIKVERPGTGDDSRGYGPFAGDRSYYFARVNRGKESISLDLHDEADREVLLQLVDRADVLVENFRPGVMARLGLSYETLSARNPRLVYCSISGFGQSGPWSTLPAYDAVVQGLSGIMAITGRPDGPPTKPGVPVADLAGGIFGFSGIMAALHGRERTGKGDRVDIAMYDSMLALLESAALQTLANGTAPSRIGNAHFSIAPFDTFPCADGDITICAANDGLFRTLCEALGRPALAGDPRFATNSLRYEHRPELSAAIAAALAGGSKEHWLATLSASGVPCGEVASVETALGSEQTLARNMVVEADGIKLPGNPMKLASMEGHNSVDREPTIDEHGAAIRAWLSGSSGGGR